MSYYSALPRYWALFSYMFSNLLFIYLSIYIYIYPCKVPNVRHIIMIDIRVSKYVQLLKCFSLSESFFPFNWHNITFSSFKRLHCIPFSIFDYSLTGRTYKTTNIGATLLGAKLVYSSYRKRSRWLIAIVTPNTCFEIKLFRWSGLFWIRYDQYRKVDDNTVI